MIVQGGGGSDTGRIATDDNAAISQNNLCKNGKLLFNCSCILLSVSIIVFSIHL